jgi:hypothetical protein
LSSAGTEQETEVIVVYAIPGFIAAGIAGSLGWGFSDWQYWASLLPVSIVSGLLYVAHGL